MRDVVGHEAHALRPQAGQRSLQKQGRALDVERA
jgi:hypothetical protein